MTRGKKKQALAIAIGVVLMIWLILTLWVEREGVEMSVDLGNDKSSHRVLIVYDPDPIYNLDEQVCRTVGRVFEEQGYLVHIRSVRSAHPLNQASYTFFVFCANTYNWRPDWAVTDYIRHANMEGKPVMAITLGSGSTRNAKRKLDVLIAERRGELIGSRAFWLLRPNEETRLKEPNVEVALNGVYTWVKETAWSKSSDLHEQRHDFP